MNHRLGPAAPGTASPEAEALRRFRTFTSSALVRDSTSPPALDGLRVNQRRTEALLLAWIETAAELAGLECPTLREALSPLVQQFRVHLRGTSAGRKSRGTPRAKRRMVVAAIDRVGEAFLAIDTDTGTIEDANPAAGALLGLNRDELLGVDAMSFVPAAQQSHLWRELDAVGEGVESHTFPATFCDSQGICFSMDASATRYTTRNKTLALILLRPGAPAIVTEAQSQSEAPPQPVIQG